MPSPAAAAVDVPMDEGDRVEGNQGERGDAALRVARVSAVEDEDAGGEPDSSNTCCVCMEPWTCSGAHRICCTPCGHIYGRSCLEKWLSAHGNTSAKCGKAFQHRHITNLYAPGNLWDGCCRIQEAEAHHSRIAKYAAELLPLVRRHASELAMSRAQLRSEESEDAARVEALTQSALAENQGMDAMLLQAEDMLAIAATRYTSLKGKMAMALRHYEDLFGFVMQSFNALLELDSK
ncbi:hypothetical protein BS78_01G512500 [Paspalum vaginatum]|nr:hypothetical protein BS78_01G512500 [Paspalum vaginatum]